MWKNMWASQGTCQGLQKRLVRPWYVPIFIHLYHKIRGVSFLTQFLRARAGTTWNRKPLTSSIRIYSGSPILTAKTKMGSRKERLQRDPDFCTCTTKYAEWVFSLNFYVQGLALHAIKSPWCLLSEYIKSVSRRPRSRTTLAATHTLRGAHSAFINRALLCAIY